LQSFQRKISKSGKPFAFVKLSDASGEYEGLLFSDGIKRYGDVLESGAPLYAQVTIDKQSEDVPPRMMFNVIKTLDDAIAENSKGLIIYVNSVAAVRPVKDALSHEPFGVNKIFIKPEIEGWDVRIELKNSYALADGKVITAIRGVSGVTAVEEI
jgi:DNA polymerase-3 subunit alpha